METESFVERKPWLAGILSSLLPGLGQFYNGEPKRGLLLYLLMSGALIVSLLIIFNLPIAPFNIILPLTLLLGLRLWVISDAVRGAKRAGPEYPLKRYNRWYIYAGIMLLSAIIDPNTLIYTTSV